MALVTHSVTADTTGNQFLPLDVIVPAPGTPVTVIASAAVNIQATKGTGQAMCPIPANTPIDLHRCGQRVYLSTATGTATVGYFYTV